MTDKTPKPSTGPVTSKRLAVARKQRVKLLSPSAAFDMAVLGTLLTLIGQSTSAGDASSVVKTKSKLGEAASSEDFGIALAALSGASEEVQLLAQLADTLHKSVASVLGQGNYSTIKMSDLPPIDWRADPTLLQQTERAWLEKALSAAGGVQSGVLDKAPSLEGMLQMATAPPGSEKDYTPEMDKMKGAAQELLNIMRTLFAEEMEQVQARQDPSSPETERTRMANQDEPEDANVADASGGEGVQFSPLMLLGLAGGGGGGGGGGFLSAALGGGGSSFSGFVIDGYVQGANVYLDMNDNLQYDAGTDFQATTDASGQFTFTTYGDTTGKKIISAGGIDVSTQASIGTMVSASVGSSALGYITPISTLYTYGGGAATLAKAGLTVADLQYDPVAALNASSANAAAAKVLQTGQSLLTLLTNTTAVVQSASSSATSLEAMIHVMDGVGTLASSSNSVGSILSSQTLATQVMESALTAAGVTDVTQYSDLISGASTAIASVNTLLMALSSEQMAAGSNLAYAAVGQSVLLDAIKQAMTSGTTAAYANLSTKFDAATLDVLVSTQQARIAFNKADGSGITTGSDSVTITAATQGKDQTAFAKVLANDTASDGGALKLVGVGRFDSYASKGAVVSATGTTIQLDAELKGFDSYKGDRQISILSGKGAGQTLHIESYDATTKTVTVSKALGVALDATSSYFVSKEVPANIQLDIVDGQVKITTTYVANATPLSQLDLVYIAQVPKATGAPASKMGILTVYVEPPPPELVVASPSLTVEDAADRAFTQVVLPTITLGDLGVTGSLVIRGLPKGTKIGYFDKGSTNSQPDHFIEATGSGYWVLSDKGNFAGDLTKLTLYVPPDAKGDFKPVVVATTRYANLASSSDISFDLKIQAATDGLVPTKLDDLRSSFDNALFDSMREDDVQLLTNVYQQVALFVSTLSAARKDSTELLGVELTLQSGWTANLASNFTQQTLSGTKGTTILQIFDGDKSVNKNAPSLQDALKALSFKPPANYSGDAAIVVKVGSFEPSLAVKGIPKATDFVRLDAFSLPVTVTPVADEPPSVTVKLGTFNLAEAQTSSVSWKSVSEVMAVSSSPGFADPDHDQVAVVVSVSAADWANVQFQLNGQVLNLSQLGKPATGVYVNPNEYLIALTPAQFANLKVSGAAFVSGTVELSVRTVSQVNLSGVFSDEKLQSIVAKFEESDNIQISAPAKAVMRLDPVSSGMLATASTGLSDLLASTLPTSLAEDVQFGLNATAVKSMVTAMANSRLDTSERLGVEITLEAGWAASLASSFKQSMTTLANGTVVKIFDGGSDASLEDALKALRLTPPLDYAGSSTVSINVGSFEPSLAVNGIPSDVNFVRMPNSVATTFTLAPVADKPLNAMVAKPWTTDEVQFDALWKPVTEVLSLAKTTSSDSSEQLFVVLSIPVDDTAQLLQFAYSDGDTLSPSYTKVDLNSTSNNPSWMVVDIAAQTLTVPAEKYALMAVAGAEFFSGAATLTATLKAQESNAPTVLPAFGDPQPVVLTFKAAPALPPGVPRNATISESGTAGFYVSSLLSVAGSTLANESVQVVIKPVVGGKIATDKVSFFDTTAGTPGTLLPLAADGSLTVTLAQYNKLLVNTYAAGNVHGHGAVDLQINTLTFNTKFTNMAPRVGTVATSTLTISPVADGVVVDSTPWAKDATTSEFGGVGVSKPTEKPPQVIKLSDLIDSTQPPALQDNAEVLCYQVTFSSSLYRIAPVGTASALIPKIEGAKVIYVLKATELALYQVVPPNYFSGPISLEFKAGSMDTNGATKFNSSPQKAILTVTATADTPVAPIFIQNTSAVEAGANASSWKPVSQLVRLASSTSVDADGSESLFAVLKVPTLGGKSLLQFAFDAGAGNGFEVFDLSSITKPFGMVFDAVNQTLTVTASQYANLAVAGAPYYSGTVTLSVQTLAKDGASSEAATSFTSADLTLTPLASGIDSTVSLLDQIVQEGGGVKAATLVALSQFVKTQATLFDNDGSEKLYYQVIVPSTVGLQINDVGSDKGFKSLPTPSVSGGELVYQFTSEQLAYVSVKPADYFSGTASLTFTPLSMESNGTIAKGKSEGVSLFISAVVDTPTIITPTKISGVVDALQKLLIPMQAIAGDRDGSETVSLKVSVSNLSSAQKDQVKFTVSDGLSDQELKVQGSSGTGYYFEVSSQQVPYLNTLAVNTALDLRGSKALSLQVNSTVVDGTVTKDFAVSTPVALTVYQPVGQPTFKFDKDAQCSTKVEFPIGFELTLPANLPVGLSSSNVSVLISNVPTGAYFTIDGSSVGASLGTDGIWLLSGTDLMASAIDGKGTLTLINPNAGNLGQPSPTLTAQAFISDPVGGTSNQQAEADSTILDFNNLLDPLVLSVYAKPVASVDTDLKMRVEMTGQSSDLETPLSWLAYDPVNEKEFQFLVKDQYQFDAAIDFDKDLFHDFNALRKSVADGDKDGFLSASELSDKVRLWTDKDLNGEVDSGELQDIAPDSKISISLSESPAVASSSGGVVSLYESTATNALGGAAKVVAVGIPYQTAPPKAVGAVFDTYASVKLLAAGAGLSGLEDAATPLGFKLELTDAGLKAGTTAKLTNLVKLTGVPDEAFLSAGIRVVETNSSYWLLQESDIQNNATVNISLKSNYSGRFEVHAQVITSALVTSVSPSVVQTVSGGIGSNFVAVSGVADAPRLSINTSAVVAVDEGQSFALQDLVSKAKLVASLTDTDALTGFEAETLSVRFSFATDQVDSVKVDSVLQNASDGGYYEVKYTDLAKAQVNFKPFFNDTVDLTLQAVSYQNGTVGLGDYQAVVALKVTPVADGVTDFAPVAQSISGGWQEGSSPVLQNVFAKVIDTKNEDVYFKVRVGGLEEATAQAVTGLSSKVSGVEISLSSANVESDANSTSLKAYREFVVRPASATDNAWRAGDLTFEIDPYFDGKLSYTVEAISVDRNSGIDSTTNHPLVRSGEFTINPVADGPGDDLSRISVTDDLTGNVLKTIQIKEGVGSRSQAFRIDAAKVDSDEMVSFTNQLTDSNLKLHTLSDGSYQLEYLGNNAALASLNSKLNTTLSYTDAGWSGSSSTLSVPKSFDVVVQKVVTTPKFIASDVSALTFDANTTLKVILPKAFAETAEALGESRVYELLNVPPGLVVSVPDATATSGLRELSNINGVVQLSETDLSGLTFASSNPLMLSPLTEEQLTLRAIETEISTGEQASTSGESNFSFSVNIQPVAQAPVVTGPSKLAVLEGAPISLSGFTVALPGFNLTTEPEAAKTVSVLVDVGSNASLWVGGLKLGRAASLTVEQFKTAQVRTDDPHFSGSLSVSVSASQTLAGNVASAVAKVTAVSVAAVVDGVQFNDNHAPILESASGWRLSLKNEFDVRQIDFDPLKNSSHEKYVATIGTFNGAHQRIEYTQDVTKAMVVLDGSTLSSPLSQAEFESAYLVIDAYADGTLDLPVTFKSNTLGLKDNKTQSSTLQITVTPTLDAPLVAGGDLLDVFAADGKPLAPLVKDDPKDTSLDLVVSLEIAAISTKDFGETLSLKLSSDSLFVEGTRLVLSDDKGNELEILINADIGYFTLSASDLSDFGATATSFPALHAQLFIPKDLVTIGSKILTATAISVEGNLSEQVVVQERVVVTNSRPPAPFVGVATDLSPSVIQSVLEGGSIALSQLIRLPQNNPSFKVQLVGLTAGMTVMVNGTALPIMTLGGHLGDDLNYVEFKASELADATVVLDAGVDTLAFSARVSIADGSFSDGSNPLYSRLVDFSATLATPATGSDDVLLTGEIPLGETSGADVVFASAEGGDIDLGDGRDALIVDQKAHSAIVDLSAGLMITSSRDDPQHGQIRNISGVDVVVGSAGDDVLSGNAFATSSVTLRGGAGQDRLIGGGGSDVLEGGAGADELTGRRGADTFVLATGSGHDVVTDFSVSDGDQIVIAGVDMNPNDLKIEKTSSGNWKVSFGANDSVELLNSGAISPEEINASVVLKEGLDLKQADLYASDFKLRAPVEQIIYDPLAREDFFGKDFDFSDVNLSDPSDHLDQMMGIVADAQFERAFAYSQKPNVDLNDINDQLDLIQGLNTAHGFAGSAYDDRLVAALHQDSVLYGGTGGNDMLFGGAGNDLLLVGEKTALQTAILDVDGNFHLKDDLIGNGGADQFVFMAPKDTFASLKAIYEVKVHDFNRAEGDRIVAVGFDKENFDIKIDDPVTQNGQTHQAEQTVHFMNNNVDVYTVHFDLSFAREFDSNFTLRMADFDKL